MIFSKDNIEFRIIDVFEVKQKNSHMYGKERNFSCISFRSQTDAVVISNGKTINMKDGTVCYFPNNIDYERKSTNEEMIAVDLEIFNYTSNEIEYYVTSNYEKLNSLFNQLYQVWTSPKKNRIYLSNSILYEILSICNHECLSKETEYKPYIYNALKYIHRNYSDPNLSVATITDKVFTNPTYLRREFKNAFNISPKQYINNLRISKAKSMLKSGYYSVKETAEACGFSDEKYFSTVFLKLVGCNPSKYKQN